MLKDIITEYLGQTTVVDSTQQVNVIKALEITDDTTQLALEFPYPIHQSFREEIISDLKQLIHQQHPKMTVAITITHKIRSHAIRPEVQAIPNVKNIIAVASGKGGVGKSTTTVNLALALTAAGAKVGILDADIYGPNQPHMLGLNQKPEMLAENRMKPLSRYGLQSISIGYLIDPNTPMIWRGPMVSRALQQLAFETMWEDLDYLLVDMPPGTGDIQLTLAQKVPVTGVVIVTTPQDIALLDARKGLEMFRKLNIPVLGVIENMSTHICSQCGHQESIFGDQGAANLARATDCELLGQLPLLRKIREYCDQGKPVVVAEPESEVSKTYQAIALRLALKLSLLPRNYAAKFPNVVVESTEDK